MELRRRGRAAGLVCPPARPATPGAPSSWRFGRARRECNRGGRGRGPCGSSGLRGTRGAGAAGARPAADRAAVDWRGGQAGRGPRCYWYFGCLAVASLSLCLPIGPGWMYRLPLQAPRSSRQGTCSEKESWNATVCSSLADLRIRMAETPDVPGIDGLMGDPGTFPPSGTARAGTVIRRSGERRKNSWPSRSGTAAAYLSNQPARRPLGRTATAGLVRRHHAALPWGRHRIECPASRHSGRRRSVSTSFSLRSALLTRR
jgi:hypothetical protein